MSQQHIASDHDVWNTCFFFQFCDIHFWLVKGQKMAKDGQKNLSVAVDISGTIYHMIVI